MSQLVNTLDQSYVTHHPVKLLAGGVDVTKNVKGSHFICTELLGDALAFEMAINDDAFFPMSMGLAIKLPGGNTFSKLRFRNPSAADISIEFYAGSIEVDDMRLNIVRGRSAPVMDAESVTTGHSQSIPGSGEVDLGLTVPPHPKYIRRATIVTNMDPAVDLELANQDDEVFASVFFRTSFLHQASDPIKVVNNSAGAVLARIAQVWWVIE